MHRSRKAFTAFCILAPITWLVLLPFAFSLLHYITLAESIHQSINSSNKFYLSLIVRDMLPLASIAFIVTCFVWLPHHITPRCLDIANIALAIVWIWKTGALANTNFYSSVLFHYHQAWI